MPRRLYVLCIALTLIGGRALANDEPDLSSAEIRTAIDKSLPLLVAGAKGSMEQRKQCFTCHNQGLPIFALTAAQSRGFDVDREHLAEQLKFIAAFLEKNRPKYLEGKGQGGQADTAGYALWTLDVGGWKPDETTAAVAEYFLLYQPDNDHWDPVSHRPPTENSAFTTTYVALRGLKTFGTAEQQERIATRTAKVLNWLTSTAPQDTEDRVFRLRGLQLAGASEESVRGAANDLLQFQREDGGWSQLVDMDSDVYATATVLLALHQTGTLKTDDPAYRRGLRLLISKQESNGSWHVVSRSKPFQTYFESGYPHGKDQFISIAAAGWATTALAFALDEQPHD